MTKVKFLRRRLGVLSNDDGYSKDNATNSVRQIKFNVLTKMRAARLYFLF